MCLPAHCGHVFTELLCGGFWPCLLVVAIFSLDFCAVDSGPACSLWPYFHWISVRWILALNAHCGHIFIGFLCGGFWPCLLVVAIFSLDCCAVDSVPECSLWPYFHWISVRWILALPARCGHIFIGLLCGGFCPCLLVVAIFSLDCCAVDSVPACSLWPYFHWIAVRWILSLNAHCGHIFSWIAVRWILSLCSLWPCFLSGSCAFSACSVTSLVSECWCIPLRYVTDCLQLFVNETVYIHCLQLLCTWHYVIMISK